MKRLTILTLLTMLSVSIFGARKAPMVSRVDPPCWWVGMRQDTLQLMVYGEGIAKVDVKVEYPGVSMAEIYRPSSPNYLFLYLKIGKDVVPGDVKLTFSEGKRKQTLKYPLLKRNIDPETFGGFDSSDVLYLIMPDRFAKGSDNPDPGKGLKYNPAPDRADHNARHGGDIAGMKQHLDYIDSLGVTAIWVNPVLTNDMEGGSYHGYATTDYYSIDPRFGTNEEWRGFVADAHSRGLKVVMDMIFNHCGVSHPWMADMPDSDWINHPAGDVMTNFRLSTVYDPYVSEYDHDRTVHGWFVPAMPDLNQRNPHLMKYLIQNSIWWIENSGIDGIRMDTHPYAELDRMAEWIRAVEREYPRFNIVGECWYGNEGGEAFWQKNSITNRKANPELPTVMDFVLSIKARDAFSGQTTPWSGLNDIYDHLALDYLFPDPSRILTFLDNHDTDRFLLEMPGNLGWWKQAMAFLLTSRGIPQIYYGTELLMNGSKEGSDGYVRRDFPGGFPGDSINAFTRTGLTPLQLEAMDFLTKVLNWRRGNRTVAEGSLKHFMPMNGLYVYERRLGDSRVVVMMNGNDEPITVSMDNVREILPESTVMTDMLTGRKVTIAPEMTFPARELLILENK